MIIDAHLHFSDIKSFKDTAKEISFLDYSYKGILNEYKNAGVSAGIVMGVQETISEGFPDYKASTPMMADLEPELPDLLYLSPGINPFSIQKNPGEIKVLEDLIKTDKKIVGLKIYAGYYPFYVYDKVYEPIYEIAAKYDLPITIHTGDTYSQRGLLKYSHPLAVDELAVTHKNNNFIIAHYGDPWVMDCAEILRKNSNVYADLSGFLVGDEKHIKGYSKTKLFVEHFKRAFVYSESYSKMLFGTDWPLAPIKSYIKFIEKLIPQKFHEQVFYTNAKNLFTRLNI